MPEGAGDRSTPPGQPGHPSGHEAAGRGPAEPERPSEPDRPEPDPPQVSSAAPAPGTSAAARPLRLPDLDPVPWTGTAAAGNTGRPYGELAPVAVPAVRPGVLGARAVPDPTGHVTGGAAPSGPARSAPPVGRGGVAARGTPADAASADRAGRRALRLALVGAGLVLVGSALNTGAPGVAGLAFLLASGAGLAAFVGGIRAVRQSRRAGVGAGRAAVAVAVGGVGILLVLAVLTTLVVFRSELARALTCVQDRGGSQAATQQCSQTLRDAVQQRVGR